MILYSIETDFIYDTAIHKAIPNDAVKISSTEKHEHMGNITYEGKRRVKHVYPFVFEDIPPPTNDDLFNKEMDELNLNFDKGMKSLSFEYNVAVARDGSTETEKVKAIRSKITALDDKYEVDQLAIINKYYGA